MIILGVGTGAGGESKSSKFGALVVCTGVSFTWEGIRKYHVDDVPGVFTVVCEVEGVVGSFL